MTARDELIKQKQKRISWLQDRIEFHKQTQCRLIAEAAREQQDIDEMRGRAGEDALVLGWNVNEANKGQD